MVCKAFVFEKNFFPVSTIVWIQSSHESSAAGAVNVFSNFTDCSSKFLSSSFKEGLTFFSPLLWSDCNAIKIPSRSLLRLSYTPHPQSEQDQHWEVITWVGSRDQLKLATQLPTCYNFLHAFRTRQRH